MKVLFNDNDDELWCVNCKCRINIGEKFVQIKEEGYDEDDVIEKAYHPGCLPEMEDDE